MFPPAGAVKRGQPAAAPSPPASGSRLAAGEREVIAEVLTVASTTGEAPRRRDRGGSADDRRPAPAGAEVLQVDDVERRLLKPSSSGHRLSATAPARWTASPRCRWQRTERPRLHGASRCRRAGTSRRRAARRTQVAVDHHLRPRGVETGRRDEPSAPARSGPRGRGPGSRRGRRRDGAARPRGARRRARGSGRAGASPRPPRPAVRSASPSVAPLSGGILARPGAPGRPGSGRLPSQSGTVRHEPLRPPLPTP